MKKCGKLAAGVLVAAMLLSGCGQAAVPEVIVEPTLVIDSDGRVTAYLVGEFDKSYYDLSELTAMAREEAAEFSDTSQDGTVPVTVKSVEAAQDGSSRIVLAYQFDSTDSYKGFIGNELFYGTVEDALSKGYIQDVILQSVKSEATHVRETLEEQKEKHLIITDVAAVIYCPERVTYLSAGAVMKEDGSVDASKAPGIVYILLRK